jgi:outer membrane receptor protein involved in Fe transport
MDRRGVFLWAITGVLLVLLSRPSPAQTLTGSITGTVKDDSGAVLPGVTVEATSPALLGGPRTVVTDAAGVYRFRTLAPGEYRISATLQGFTPFVVEHLTVTMGGTVTVDGVMKVAGVKETVTVSGQAPVVDVSSSGMTASYDRALIEAVPVQRSGFIDVVALAPGVNRMSSTSDSWSAFGADTTVAGYRFDGVDTSGVDMPGAWVQPIPDVYQEVQVVGLGAPPEYGGYMGAAVNVISKSGGNTFSGGASFYLQTGGLTSGNAPPGEFSYHRDKYNDFTAQLGGPIKKDKIWFFGAYQYLRDGYSTYGTDPTYPSLNKIDRFFGKFSWAISRKHELWVSFHDELDTFPDAPSPTVMPEALTVTKQKDPSPAVHWQSVLNDKTLFQAKYAGYYWHQDYSPVSGCYTCSQYYDYQTNITSGGVYYFYDTTPEGLGYGWNVSRTQAEASLSRYADNFAGRHTLKLGVQYSRGYSNALIGYGGGAVFYTYGGEPYLKLVALPHWYGGTGTTWSAYGDDTWQVGGRLTLNLGLRYDYQVGNAIGGPEYGADGKPTGAYIPPVNKAAVWSNFAPRLGLAYQLTADRKTVLKLNYGRYVDYLRSNTVQAVDKTITPAYYYGYNYETGQYDQLVYVYDPVKNQGVDPNLFAPTTDAYVLALERELAAGFAVSAMGMYNKTKGIVSYWNTGGVYEPAMFYDAYGNQEIPVWNQVNSTDEDFYETTNRPEYKHQYRGLVLTLNKRMSQGWQMSSSLTISKADGVCFTTGGGQGNTNRPIDPYMRDPNYLVNNSGPLDADRTYVFKVAGSYNLPYDARVAVNYVHQTGVPYARTVQLTGLNQTLARTILATPRIYRFPSQDTLDLRFEKAFKFSGNMRLAILLDVFNSLNRGAPIRWISTVGTSDQYLVPANLVQPRVAQLGFRFTF